MKAWQLIEKPENWTQEAGARDTTGKEVSWDVSEAVSFCMLGALAKCYCGGELLEQENRIRTKIGGSIVIFNDDHPHAEVLAVLKELDI